MKKFWGSFQKLAFPDWSIPLALLAICLLAYGILLNKIGFYQDDWHFLYYAYTRGQAGLAELLNYDGHPLAVWFYSYAFKLLGFNPLNWQIFSLFWRWLAITSFWLLLHRTWPQHRRLTFTAAAVYAIYPLYTLQSLAIVYYEVWISHFLLAISFLLTIEAIKKPGRFWLFITLAFLIKVLHVFSSEYTWGMELTRPFFMYFALSSENSINNLKQRLNKIAQIFAPFLLVTLLVFIWRGFYYQSPVLVRSEPRLINQIIANPAAGIISFITKSIPDLILILFSSWFPTVNPSIFAFENNFNLQITGFILLSAVFVGLYLYKLDTDKTDPITENKHWSIQVFLTGVAILIFGMIPSYAAGYFVHLKLEPWNGRFVIGSMPGVALLTAYFLQIIIDSPKKRLAVTALLIALGIGWQVRMMNDYRWAWNAELDFFHQLLIRVPAFEPDTAFLSEIEFLGRMGDYPTAFAINTMYAKPGKNNNNEAPTWLFLVNTNFAGRTDGITGNKTLEETKHSTHFSGKSSNSLIISYEPELGQCMWLITPEHYNIPIIPQTLRDISSLSNTKRIRPNDPPNQFINLISQPQSDNWCTHYQRGSLDFQLGDWKNTTKEWETAVNAGLHPVNGYEYLPFIKAYSNMEDWKNAVELTKSSNRATKGMANGLCSVWRQIKTETNASQKKDEAINQIWDMLKCN